ncbi:aromatic ring-opening dioxygenase LigA [Agromyces larvae]|uniref:Aromatic ring-opening dioxygenase LigA n=1 Tax=Agromyces larvae TaxID=2929802 RepID=A0ABY4BVI5_9MICO|nr:aromatic ring-opening dioxygenase LigA [Agromyces larvae]UOE43222.1 aromatic ring-opening dioxygenase LigA [Agromyces larvae]
MSAEDFETGTAVLSAGRVKGVRLVGLAGIIGGILLIIVAILAWIMVTTELRAESITVPDDAMAFQGQQVSGPLTAYVQAEIIREHALAASGGKTFAQLSQDDPVRATMANASFLRASLFTSVVSYGVALFAAAAGLLFLLFGWALRALVPPLPRTAS